MIKMFLYSIWFLSGGTFLKFVGYIVFRGGGIIVQIVQRHHFASHLKRMAVVVRTEEQFFAFVKVCKRSITSMMVGWCMYHLFVLLKGCAECA